MLPLVVVGCTSKQSVSQCVKPPPPPAWIMQPPPDWQTPLNGIISSSEERLMTMQKQLEGAQEYIRTQCIP
uniref:Rz1 family lipoprotein n=1 Tax=Escherichia albertii TaxID=208962 RepID=UPI00374E06A2